MLNGAITDGGDRAVAGYCLELLRADFLAGRTEESSLEETLLVIQRSASLGPPEYLARVMSQIQIQSRAAA